MKEGKKGREGGREKRREGRKKRNKEGAKKEGRREQKKEEGKKRTNKQATGSEKGVKTFHFGATNILENAVYLKESKDYKLQKTAFS